MIDSSDDLPKHSCHLHKGEHDLSNREESCPICHLPFRKLLVNIFYEEDKAIINCPRCGFCPGFSTILKVRFAWNGMAIMLKNFEQAANALNSKLTKSNSPHVYNPDGDLN